MNPPYRPSTHRNPSKGIFRPSLRSVAPKEVEERREEEVRTQNSPDDFEVTCFQRSRKKRRKTGWEKKDSEINGNTCILYLPTATT